MKKAKFILPLFLLMFVVFLFAKPVKAACKNMGEPCSVTDTMCSASYACINGTVSLKPIPSGKIGCSAQGADSGGITTKSGNVHACVGGFLTKTDLRNTRLEVSCQGKDLLSRKIFGDNPLANITWFCGGDNKQGFDLANTPDSEIQQDSDGTYFTCQIGQGIDETIHDVRFTYFDKTTNQELCKSEVYTIDKNTPCLNDICNTALGFISTKLDGPKNFISDTLTLAIGFAGTIALLLMLYGLFLVITSGNNPKQLQAGQDVITSAVSGLIFIVLSVIMLKVIGVDILGLPGL